MTRMMLVCLCAVGLTQCSFSQTPITAIAVQGDTVVSCSKAGLQIHSVNPLERLRARQLPIPSAHDLAFSPDGMMLAVAGGTPAVDGSTCIFSWPECELLTRLGDHTDVAMAVCWLGDSEIASGSLDGTVQVWNVTTKQKRSTFKGHSRGILTLCKFDEGRLLVSAGIDQSLRVWKLPTGDLLRSLTIHTRPIQCVATRPVRSGLPMIASASDDRSVRFWQPTIGRMVRFARLDSKPVSLAWLPDGSRVIAICADGSLYSIDPDTVVASELSPSTESVAYALTVDARGKAVFVSVGAKLRQLSINVSDP